MRFSHEVVINRSREEVWRVFDNPENMPKWQPALKSFEHQRGERGQPGAVSFLVYEENGRTIELTETITRRTYPDEFSGSYTGSHATNNITNRFIPLGDAATKWEMDSEFVFHSIFLKLFSPLMKGMFVKRVAKDMDRFKQLAESE
ncbi:MAG: SRPBCC family protein [Blastocatellia bacterium]